MNDIEAYKNYQRIKVILSILILVIPFTYFLLYIDLAFTYLILNINTLSLIRYLFGFSWWRISIFLFLQYCVFILLGSIYYHTGKAILRNKDFFLS